MQVEAFEKITGSIAMAMRCVLPLCWLFAASFVMMAGVQAESVSLEPTAGLQRETDFGPTYDEDTGSYDGPPGLIGQSFEATTIPWVAYDNDERYGQGGYVADQLLLYDLRSLSGATLSQAKLQFDVNYAIRSVNYPGEYADYRNPGFSDFVDISLSGTTDPSLDRADFGLPSASSTGFRVAGLENGESVLVDVDITNALTKLIGQGFDHVAVLLSTSDNENTSFGPTGVGFARAPSLEVTGTGFPANTSSVPEASSIIDLGLAVAGLGVYLLRGGARAR
jgi:hypothetical protein